jgi:hypothetical protein
VQELGQALIAPMPGGILIDLGFTVICPAALNQKAQEIPVLSLTPSG